MFSGIIENIGTVKEYKKIKDYRLILDTDLNFRDVKKNLEKWIHEFEYKI